MLFESVEVAQVQQQAQKVVKYPKSENELLPELEQPFAFASVDAAIEFIKLVFNGGQKDVKSGEAIERFKFKGLSEGSQLVVQIGYMPVQASQIQDQRKRGGKESDEDVAKGLATISGTLHVISNYNGATRQTQDVLNGDAFTNGVKAYVTIGGQKLRATAFSVIATQSGKVKGTTPYSNATLPYYNPREGRDLLGSVQESLIGAQIDDDDDVEDTE